VIRPFGLRANLTERSSDITKGMPHMLLSHPVTRLLGLEALVGMLAAVLMLSYAMLASVTFLHQGICTPLYGAASPLLGDSSMMRSMQQEMYVTPGPLLLGLLCHLLWAAFYGALFGALLCALRLRGVGAMMGGLLYGLLVMLFMGFVLLPVVGAAALPALIGWPSFTIEHVLFGFMLGLWPVPHPQDVHTLTPGAPLDPLGRGCPAWASSGGHRLDDQSMCLDIYIGSHCDNCQEALSLAALARGMAGVEVTVIDLDASDAEQAVPQVPPTVFAVPTYLLDGQLLSLGNPSREAFLAALHRPAQKKH
jgi:hypothetical protein